MSLSWNLLNRRNLRHLYWNSVIETFHDIYIGLLTVHFKIVCLLNWTDLIGLILAILNFDEKGKSFLGTNQIKTSCFPDWLFWEPHPLSQYSGKQRKPKLLLNILALTPSSFLLKEVRRIKGVMKAKFGIDRNVECSNKNLTETGVGRLSYKKADKIVLHHNSVTP